MVIKCILLTALYNPDILPPLIAKKNVSHESDVIIVLLLLMTMDESHVLDIPPPLNVKMDVSHNPDVPAPLHVTMDVSPSPDDVIIFHLWRESVSMVTHKDWTFEGHVIELLARFVKFVFFYNRCLLLICLVYCYVICKIKKLFIYLLLRVLYLPGGICMYTYPCLCECDIEFW